MRDRLFILSQYLLPHHLLSRLAGALANCTWDWVKNPFINWFVKRYQVDMTQAVEQDPTAYACFNDFFTRALVADARAGPGRGQHPLPGRWRHQPAGPHRAWPHLPGQGPQLQRAGTARRQPGARRAVPGRRVRHRIPVAERLPPGAHRSEERRVGKEGAVWVA